MPTSLPGSWEQGWLNLTLRSEPRDQSELGSYHLQCFVPWSTDRNLSKKWKREYWSQVQPMLKRREENRCVIVKQTFERWKCKQLSFARKKKLARLVNGDQQLQIQPNSLSDLSKWPLIGSKSSKPPEGLLVLAKCKSWYDDYDFILITKWTPVHIAEPLVMDSVFALAMSQMSRTKMSVLQKLCSTKCTH